MACPRLGVVDRCGLLLRPERGPIGSRFVEKAADSRRRQAFRERSRRGPFGEWVNATAAAPRQPVACRRVVIAIDLLEESGFWVDHVSKVQPGAIRDMP